MKITPVVTAVSIVLLLSLQAMGNCRLPQHYKHPTNNTRHDPSTSVPSIARLLGVRVGFNGQQALIQNFGDGLHSTGGHPGGMIHWNTHHPSGYIETDGFSYNEEGLAIEQLYWALDRPSDPKIPFVRHLPRHAGWLGVVYPGMTTKQVSQLTTSRLPVPLKKGEVWVWQAKGFVRPSPVNEETYTTWTAKLTFQKGVLNSIEIRIGWDDPFRTNWNDPSQ